MAKRFLLSVGAMALAFVVLLLLRWPPAWDALFRLAYRLNGYGPHAR